MIIVILPIGTKQLLRRASSRLRSELSNVLALRKGGFLLQGHFDADGQAPLTMLYLGTEDVRNDFAYWFKGDHSCDPVSSAKVRELLSKDAVDGLVVERSRYAEAHFLPHIVARISGDDERRKPRPIQTILDFQVVCGGSFEDYLTLTLKKRMRNNVRRALKQDFVFRVSSEEQDVATMYERLLVPATKSRHGEHAYIPPLRDFFDALPALQVHICENEDGTPLVANFVLRSQEIGFARLWRQGLALEVLTDSKLRSLAATFAEAHTIQQGIIEGLRTISFGKGPCLSSDGGFKNKLAWGCRPQIDKTYPLCYLYGLSSAMMEACTALGLQDLVAVENFARFPDENLRKAG